MLSPLELSGPKGLQGLSLGGPGLSMFGQGTAGAGQPGAQQVAPQFLGALPSGPEAGDIIGEIGKNAVTNMGVSVGLNALQNSLAGAENLVYSGGNLVPVDVAMGDAVPYSSYAGPVIKLMQGDVGGAAKQAAATAIGSFFGPVGAIFGSIIGGGCFITEAVIESIGGEDDQPILRVLRGFRDNVMMNSIEGVRLVNQYYKTAPKIVAALNGRKDRQAVYRQLFSDYIEPAAQAAAAGENDQALALYSAMIAETSRLTGVRGMKTTAEKLARGA